MKDTPESMIVNIVIYVMGRHPALAWGLGAATLVTFLWKALPHATRMDLEVRHPRMTGLIRVCAAVGFDVLGAIRTGVYGVVRGEARPLAHASVVDTTADALIAALRDSAPVSVDGPHPQQLPLPLTDAEVSSDSTPSQ